MPEPRQQSDTLRAGAPVHIGAVTLLPIERVVLHAAGAGACLWFAAAKQPYALVLREAGRVRAIDTQAAEIQIDTLRALVPRLDAALAAM